MVDVKWQNYRDFLAKALARCLESLGGSAPLVESARGDREYRYREYRV